MSKSDVIRKIALKIISENKNGIRWADLSKQIKKALHDDIKPINVAGTLVGLPYENPPKVYKPEEGLWRSVEFRETNVEEDIQEPAAISSIKEEDFYESVAEYCERA